MNLKKMNLDAARVLQQKELKSILGGQPLDGFSCASEFDHCDRRHPDNFGAFQICMYVAGC